jgi:hypothetical protein
MQVAPNMNVQSLAMSDFRILGIRLRLAGIPTTHEIGEAEPMLANRQD